VVPSTGAAQDDSARVLPHAPTVDRLPNGLTVISVPFDSPGILAYYTLVRVGSRDEVEPGHSGFAHLFEHMMFRGTERFPEAVYEETIQSFGADNNAYTTNDYTMYHLTVPTSALDRVVDLEADRFQHLSYTETQFRTETGAVRGEYDKSASSPWLRMEETMSELAFSRHTYRHTVIGYLRDIEAMAEKVDYSRNFLRRFYTPDNCTIVVAGDVDHGRLMTLVRQHYGSWRGRRDNPRIPREPEPTQGAERHLDWEGSSPPRMWVAYRIPSFDGNAGRNATRAAAAMRETAALQIIHGLAFADSSPLYQRLVVDEQRLLSLDSWEQSFSRDPGLFTVDAMLKPGESFAPIRDAIQEELGRIAAGQTPAERIAAVQSHLRYRMIVGLQTPDDAADLVATFVAFGGDVASVDRYQAALAAVTPEDVQRVAQRYLIPNRRFVVTLAPRPAAEPAPAAGGAP
jgi:zinc protease